MPADDQLVSNNGYSAKGKTKGKRAPPAATGKSDGKGKRPTYRESAELNKMLAASSKTPLEGDTSKTTTVERVEASDAVRTDYPSAKLAASNVFGEAGGTGNCVAIRCTWDSFGGPNATYVLLQSKSGEEGSFEPICFGGGHSGEAKYSNRYDAMPLTPDTTYYFQICALEDGAAKPGPCQPTPPLACKTAPSLKAAEANEEQAALFDTYALSERQRHIFHAMKQLRNMPSFFAELADEEIVWAVAMGTADLPDSPDPSDMCSCEAKVEERLRRLEQAESRFGWFSLRWTKPIMRRLLCNWFCGMLVIDPDLQTREGSPIQFVHEYYGDESRYPGPEGQTAEWKQESIDLYVLMARSICLAYPMATTKGIVSFSDMQDFDWSKYDMGSKERNADIGSLLPNRLARMITFNPDEKMRQFYEDMNMRARREFGFAQYEDFKSALAEESDLLPQELPTFVGGTRKVDVLKCLKFLFRREPEATALLLESHSEMEESGELPRPKHME